MAGELVVGIDLLERFSHDRDEVDRVAPLRGTPHDDPVVPPPVLIAALELLGTRRRREPLLPLIADDADDLVPRGLGRCGSRVGYALPDRILSGEVLPRERLVHDHDSLGAHDILSREGPALEEAHAH